MAIDIKSKIEELIKKITSDKNLLESFKSEPAKTVEKLIGIKLPEDQLNQIVAGVKAKISVDSLKGVADKFGSLLGKK